MDLVILVVPAAASWLALPLGGWRPWAGWVWWSVGLVATALVFVGYLLVGGLLAGLASVFVGRTSASFGWLLPWAVVAVAVQAGAAVALARRVRSEP